MEKRDSELTEEQQRLFQASAWGLTENASWIEIRSEVRVRGQNTMLFDPDDWQDSMVNRYGTSIFSEPLVA